MHAAPGPVGLYDPRLEHDACGVSFVAHIKGVASHDLVLTGLVALTNLAHRGATGAEPDTGDGAGVLVQVPDRFLRAALAEQGVELPPAGRYAVGLGFLPADPIAAEKSQAAIENIVADEGLAVLAWRDVPVEPSCLGATARAVMPAFTQLFVTDPAGAGGFELDRKVYLARKRIEHELDPGIATYFASLSSRTLVYKGMLTTPQLAEFFPDLTDDRFESALLLVHSRFSTNTFPSWPLAHPYRYVAHNGEINTVQGNQNWMRAREAMLDGSVFPNIERAFPICTPGASDTARFDEVLELLHLGGRPIHHAVLMMIPPAWENNDELDPAQRDFYRFHSSVMEPWDGPGQRRLQRRHRDRRRARPQRPATQPLLGHRRRHRRDGVGGGGHRRRPGQGDHEGSPAARGACSSSTRPRAASSTTRRSRRRWPPSTRTAIGSSRASSSSRT